MSEQEEATPTPTRPDSPMRREMKTLSKRRFRTAIAVTIAVLFFLGWRGYLLFMPLSKRHDPVKVEIPEGATPRSISEVLEQDGVIRSGVAFQIYTRWKGQGARFHAGKYVLYPDMRFKQIVNALNVGPNGAYDDRPRVTIPEGYTLVQIADILESKGVVSKEKFLKTAATSDGIRQLHASFPLPEDTLEGYLYPDTYFFRREEPPVKVIEEMLMNFSAKFYRPYLQEMEKRKANLHDIVTIGSLIEKEAKAPQDRARIAGVITNRLDKKQKLEIDATVLYALGKHKDRVLFADLKVKSPYNTYQIAGLPPGAIANPGLNSLIAALLPEENPYYYYVARPDGTHIFSRTLAEHESAKKQVRKERSGKI